MISMFSPIYRAAVKQIHRRQLRDAGMDPNATEANARKCDVAPLTAITLLCNVLPMTLRPGWCGELLVGVGHGLGHSPLCCCSLVLSCLDRQFHETHQNGRSRAAVASSLLSRLAFSTLPCKGHCAGFPYFKPSFAHTPSPMRSVRGH
ncbi:hypothetical protein V8C34DRAFT_217096 [Trichoderma compactum]